MHIDGGEGGATGCNAPTTNMDAPTENLQNIKHTHDDQPAQQCVTLYCVHLLPLLDCRSWNQLIFKNVCICVYARYFLHYYGQHYVIQVLILWS
jgi:hypothetical protein